MYNTKELVKIMAATLLAFTTITTLAQNNWNNIYSLNDVTRDTISRQGYTLVFVNKDSAFDTTVEQNMINAFFKVYPGEVSEYNQGALKQVVIIIDPAYEGVAATDHGIVRVNPAWMHKHPQDVDVVTHEVMHIVQAYPNDAGPGWITEGIADYARYKFGVNNNAGGWKLTPFNSKQSYTNAYRVTARFFAWIEKNYENNFVKKLDAAMRNKRYTGNFWKKETGKTVDELWNIYAENPVI